MEAVLVGVLVVLKEDFNLVVHLLANVLTAKSSLKNSLVPFSQTNTWRRFQVLPMIPQIPKDREERQVVRSPTT